MKRFRFGLLGILFAGFVCMVAPAYAQSGYVATDLLNVRTAPSMNSDVVEILAWGEPLTITYGPTMGWYEIYRNGGCYYVKADYVSSAASGADAGGYTYSEEPTYGESVGYSAGTDYGYAGQTQEYLGNFVLTAYCSCSKCTSGSGVTASGTTPVEGHTVAMGGVPFGTKLLINGTVYTVEDRGTSYGHVDIYLNNHQDAVNFGTQYADVYQVW